jgi:hypothetical protein
MFFLIAGPAARARERQDNGQADHHDRSGTDRNDHTGDGRPPSRVWALMEAIAYAGAYIDPTGVLVAQRLREAAEEAARHGQR